MISKRYPRKIPKNTSSHRPKHFIFFDTETTGAEVKPGKIEQQLRLYVAKLVSFSENGAYDVVKTVKSTDKRDFILLLDFCCMQYDNVLIASHNLIFDFTVLQLLDNMERNGYSLIQFYSRQLATQFRYIKDGVTFTFFDTVSLFQASIKNIGTIVGLNKLETDLATSNDEELFRYCERDTDIIIEMTSYWYRFLNDNNFGDFRTTLASTSFSIYRHRFMNTAIDIHCNDEVLKLERLAYKGGRVELFYKGYSGYKKLYKLDINSMYPYVMYANKYPTKLVAVYDSPGNDFLKNRLERYCCIAYCNISVSEPIITTKIAGRNIYPTGSFDCYITTGELKYVLLNHTINKIYYLAIYKAGNIFRDFVENLYQKRVDAYNDGNKPMYMAIKLILNSLYGKFGQLGTEFAEFGIDEKNKYSREYGYDSVSQRHFTITTINHRSYIEYYGGESAMSFPAIAAHVTAYARIYLYEMLKKIVRGRYYYVDTDSIIVDEQGYKELSEYIDTTMLGKLKIEHTATRAIFYAPKDYSFGGIKRLKGISRNAIKVEKDVYQQQKWQRFAGLFIEGDPDKYFIHQVQKRLKRIVYSGRIGDDGFLSPWCLPEDYDTVSKIMKSL